MHPTMLDNYVLPDGATEALKRAGLQEVRVDNGISHHAGHDGGVPIRFYIETEYNEKKSKAARYEKSLEIQMIEWDVDKHQKTPERVQFLPPELLEFEPVDIGDEGPVHLKYNEWVIDETTGKRRLVESKHRCIGGRFMESYLRWIQGLEAPGLSLSKWGVIPDGWVKTLVENGIFSVEQFAAKPRALISSRYPKEVQEYFERAILFVNGKQNRVEADKQAEKIMALESDKAAMESRMAALEELLKEKKAPKKGKKKAEETDSHGN